MQMDQRRAFFLRFVILASCLGFSYAASAAVRINELMASNKDALLNGLNESSDWIELHNDSSETVNVGGMYLTDNTDTPNQWQIPSGTRINGKSFLIIWADGESSPNELHANFGLSASGEQLALYDTDGQTLLDSVAFDRQTQDISYGRSPGDPAQWQYMDRPTPDEANKNGYFGLVEDTQFSVDRGFYDHPFEVAISTTTPDAFILYTTDASDPTNSATVTVYSGPIAVNKTTCLRAYAMRPTWRPTNVDTQTYLFLDDVIALSQATALADGYPDTWNGNYPGDYEMDPEVTQDPGYRDPMKNALRSLPTLSLVTHKDHLFSKDKDPDTGGIYIYTGAGTGDGWERPVSAEFLDVDKAQEFQVNCGLRLQGGASRKPEKMPKHSFSLRFRKAYGPGKLNFPFFDNWPVDSFDSLQLRAFFNNTWAHWAPDQRQRATYIRDQWMRDTLTAMGQQDAGQGLYVHLYINGMYWGMYNLEERPAADHYAAYNGGDPDRIDAFNFNQATDGTLDQWNHLKQVVRQKDWDQIQTLMDVSNFIDFMIAQLYASNQDIKEEAGNWRSAGGGPDQQPWRFYSWDSEHIMESVTHTVLKPSQNPTGLWDSMRQIPQFREQFADRVHKHLFNHGPLTPGPAAERFSTRANEIEEAVIAESARWGDYRRDMHPYRNGPYHLYTRDTFWTPERDKLINSYFPQRTEKAISIFKSMGLYPAVEAPTFHVEGDYQHGGTMIPGQSLSMASSEPTVFYTLDGTDPKETAESPLNAQHYAGPITLPYSSRVKARAYDRQWSALNEAVYSVGPIAESLRITELMYHPADPNTEYIELVNVGHETINLNLVHFSNGIDFAFDVTELIPGEHVLIVEDSAAFTTVYGNALPVIGEFRGSLDNAGERLILKDATGTEILNFKYKDSWYKTTDGQGHSLEVIQPTASAPATWSDPNAWQASRLTGGTPGL